MFMFFLKQIKTLLNLYHKPVNPDWKKAPTEKQVDQYNSLLCFGTWSYFAKMSCIFGVIWFYPADEEMVEIFGTVNLKKHISSKN